MGSLLYLRVHSRTTHCVLSIRDNRPAVLAQAIGTAYSGLALFISRVRALNLLSPFSAPWLQRQEMTVVMTRSNPFRLARHGIPPVDSRTVPMRKQSEKVGL